MKRVLILVILVLFLLTSIANAFFNRGEKQEFILKHPAWESAVTIEKNRLHNVKTNAWATLLYQTPNQIIVKWDNYGIERFVKSDKIYVLDSDYKIDDFINQKYAELTYDFHTPYIIVNPYSRNPLSALIKFPTEKPAQITLRIKGIPPADDIVHTFKVYKTEHTIPIYGLYPNHENIIELTAHFEDGTLQKSVQTVKTEPLDSKFFYLVTQKKDSKTKYYYGSMRQNNVYDEYGYIRFSFPSSNAVFWINGRLVEDIPNKGLNIYNKLGKHLFSLPYTQKGQPTFQSYRHGVYELPNDRYIVIGDLPDTKALVKNKSTPTAHDILLTLPRQDSYASSIDLGSILNPARGVIFEIEKDSLDWAHANAVQYVLEDDSLIISMKHIGFIKTDYKTGTLKWIAAPHLNWDTSGRDNKGPALTDKLLTAVDKNLNPFPLEIQTGAVRSEAFSWPINNHDLRTVSGGGGIYTIFSNNGRVNDKRLMSKKTSEVMIYKIDEKAKTIQMLYKYNLPDFSSIASGASYFPKEKDLFIYAAFIQDKNNKDYNKIYRLNTQTGEILFEAVLYTDTENKWSRYHYNMYPIHFYEEDETWDVK